MLNWWFGCFFLIPNERDFLGELCLEKSASHSFHPPIEHWLKVDVKESNIKCNWPRFTTIVETLVSSFFSEGVDVVFASCFTWGNADKSKRYSYGSVPNSEAISGFSSFVRYRSLKLLWHYLCQSHDASRTHIQTSRRCPFTNYKTWMCFPIFCSMDDSICFISCIHGQTIIAMFIFCMFRNFVPWFLES